MRFLGQAFEIPVPIEATSLPSLTAAELAARFTEAHRRVYLHGGEPGRRAEIVSLRFTARRRLEVLPEVRERAAAVARGADAPVRLADGSTVAARLVDAATLAPGDIIAGPAMIEGYSSSTWVPAGWQATRDGAGNIIIARRA